MLAALAGGLLLVFLVVRELTKEWHIFFSVVAFVCLSAGIALIAWAVVSFVLSL